MADSIQIIEKPDWISWEKISECLCDAHTKNRENGIRMIHSHWPAEQLREYIGDCGKTFVALDGDKLIGTASFRERIGNKWYTKGPYAYLCLAGVLPEYRGCGVYKELCMCREEYIRERGYEVLVLDTHERNVHLQNIAAKQGFQKVNYFMASNKEHFNVIMAKRVSGRPFPPFYCSLRFHYAKMKVHLVNWILALNKREERI